MIWQVTTTIEGGEAYMLAELAEPPRLRWVNEQGMRQNLRTVVDEYASHEFSETPSLAFSSMPTPILQITDAAWNLDYFTTQAYHFSSIRLRRAFGVGPDVVRFRDIDTSPSVPEVQGLGYSAFDVLQFGNPFDPARTVGDVREVRQPDGST